VSVVGRAAVAMAGATLTWVLLVFAAGPAVPGRHKVRRPKLARLSSANLMSYVAAVMAVALASTVALT